MTSHVNKIPWISYSAPSKSPKFLFLGRLRAQNVIFHKKHEAHYNITKGAYKVVSKV